MLCSYRCVQPQSSYLSCFQQHQTALSENKYLFCLLDVLQALKVAAVVNGNIRGAVLFIEQKERDVSASSDGLLSVVPPYLM